MNGRNASFWVVICVVAMGLQACPAPVEKVAEDQGDLLENWDMSLDEAGVVASGAEAGGALRVELPFVAKRDGVLAHWRVTLIRDGFSVASVEGDYRAMAQGEHRIVTHLRGAAPDLSEDKGRVLGSHVLQYSMETKDGAVRGRRSLASAWKRQDVVILGSDTFDPHTPSLLRVLVRDPASGSAVRAQITAILYTVDGERPIYEGATDAAGVAEIVMSAGPAEVGQATIRVLVESSIAVDHFELPITIASAEKMLVTTDKPLYQPGQTIHIRTLTLDRASLRPAAEREMVLEVQDAEGNYLMRENLVTDAFGIASWDFPLANQLNMGTWTLTAHMGDVTATRTVVVDRYKLPRFDARIQLDRTSARPGEIVRATVSSRYFFGEPVAGGELVVQASTAQGTIDRPIATLLDDEGVAAVDLRMPSQNIAGGVDVQIAAIVTDKTGQQFTARRTVPVSNTDILLALLPVAELVPGDENRFLVLTSSPARQPVAADCNLTIDRVRTDFNVDETGVTTVSALIPEGLASVPTRLECFDQDGRYALRSWQMDLSTQLRDGVVSVETDKALYEAGESAQVLVRHRDRTGTERLAGPLHIDVLRQGQVLDSVATESGKTVAIDIDPTWFGTLQFEAYALTLGGAVRRSRTLAYVAPSRRLQVNFTTDQELYRPGQEATLKVHVTDEEGRPAVAAVGLNIVDEAVYALQDTKPGLEKLTFQLEPPSTHAEVAAHGYSARQVVVGDESRRAAAAMAVFATTDAPGHGIEVRSRTAQSESVNAAAGELFRRDLQRVAGRFNTALAYPEFADGGVFWDPTRVQQLIDIVAPSYDPWGQPYLISADASPGYVQGFQVVSSGPDEIGGTADDLTGSLYANGSYVGVR